MRSMKFIQNYHNEHTKLNFGMLIVVILYEFHTLHFAVYNYKLNSYKPSIPNDGLIFQYFSGLLNSSHLIG